MKGDLNYVVEMLAACLLFALPLKKKNWFELRFAIGVLLSLMISRIVGTPYQHDIIKAVGIYLFQLATVILPIWLSCDVSLNDAVYGTICAYAMQHFASSLYILLCISVMGASPGKAGWFYSETVGLYLGSYLLSYGTMYYLFALPLGKTGKYGANLLKAGGLTMLVLPITLVLSLIVKLSSGTSNTSFMLFQVYSMLCSVFVLWVQTSQNQEIYWRTELAVQQKLWQNQKEQYQVAQDTIRVINHKCHDLKHQVAALRTVCSEQQREAALKEIEQAIMIYDAAVQTGNQVLDTILTEKSLVCESRNIQWTCMADGKRLSFLNPVDLYVIFGNALDNAIEAVQQIPDSEKRVISVNVFGQKKFVILQIENYYEHDLKFQNGLPLSTKEEWSEHGFGMNSIRQTVEKYNGSLSVQIHEHIFILSIIFPTQ